MLWSGWLNGARYVLARQVYQNLDLPSALFGQVVVQLREEAAGALLDHPLHFLRSPHCMQRGIPYRLFHVHLILTRLSAPF